MQEAQKQIIVNKQGPIVVIKDDADDQVLLMEVFAKLNYQNKVLFFFDGQEALDYIDRSDDLPFLILSDINMPKMNGFELYYKIRESDDKVNICFLTAGEIYEEISKQIFPNEPFNTREEKIHFIGIPIANEDLVKQVKEVLGLP